MKHTVIAVFDQAEDIQKATHRLRARGFDASAIHVTQGAERVDEEVIPPAAEIEGGPLTGLLHRLSVLFGVDEPHLAHYQEAVRRRSSVVQVDAADEAQAAVARDTLLEMGAANIDDRIEGWQREGWRDSAAAEEPTRSTRPAGNAGVFVHRQEVSIGGVRVYGQDVVVAFEELADDFRADYQLRHSAQGTTYDDPLLCLTFTSPAIRYTRNVFSRSASRGSSWRW